MNHLKLRILLLSAIISIISLQANESTPATSAESDQQDGRACSITDPCCPGESTLKLDKLCAKMGSFECLQSDRIVSEDICTNRITAQQICTPSFQTNNLCALQGAAERFCVNHLQANELCGLRAIIRQLCVEELSAQRLCVRELRNCGFNNARVILDHDILYTLGEPLVFNQVVADPSNSILLSPTRYVAPENGTYMVTVQAITSNLSGPSIIAGHPIGLLEIYVNNLLRRQTFAPYLTFNTTQNVFNTSLIYLRQGDVLTSTYKVQMVDPTNGLMEYPGTVILQGNPLFSLRSFISVAQISSDCSQDECSPCDMECDMTPCQVNCTPCPTTPCVPCCPIS